MHPKLSHFPVLVLLPAAAAAQATLYSIPAPPGGTEPAIYGLSADGTAVVGTYTRDNLRPFRWTRVEGSVDIADPVEGIFETVCCSGGGQVVIGFGVFPDHIGPWRWTAEDGLTVLPAAPDDSLVIPYSISADGLVIAGTLANNGPRAFRGTDGYGYEAIPALGTNMQAMGICSNGSTVVGVFSGGGTRSFYWRSTTGTVEAPIQFPYYYQGVTGISAGGRYLTGRCGQTACRYDIDGGAATLLYWADGSPLVGTGIAISADGTVIAGVHHGVDAFLWTESGGGRDLGELLRTDHGLDVGALRWVNGMSDDGAVIAGHDWVVTFAEPQPFRGRPPCQGDVDGDERVGLSDLLHVLGEYRRNPPDPRADLTGDGVVDALDLNIVLVEFGDDCARRRLQSAERRP